MQARPDPVQKFAATPTPPGLPVQQFCPLPPHGPVAQPPVPPLQAPRVAPHVAPLARQVPSTQHPPAQVLFWQHASPVEPQATCAPATQTSVGVFSPLA
jgi:hypothetical protein